MPFEAYMNGLPVEGDKTYMVYRYRGLVERGVGGRYVWREGFSQTTKDGSVLYPWLTKKEAQADAARFNRKAKFVRDTPGTTDKRG